MEYEEIRKKYLETGELYEDPDFPVGDSSIGKTMEGVEWKRPKEICDEPKLTIANANMSHFIQGKIGNCWFATAIGALTANPELLGSVCQPEDQGFEEGQYCGSFCFRFWQYDNWITVIIDDRLPTVDNHLVFLHSKDESEFLGPLLEKAYAKIRGSYDELNGGHSADAMTDLTSGFVEFVTNSSDTANKVQQALHKRSLTVASITEDSDQPRIMSNGLTANHAYNVIQCIQVENNDGQNTCLVHLRDPKGLVNWNGAWSCESENWKNVPEETATQLQSSIGIGEFWLPETDFKENITTVEICSCVSEKDETDSCNRKIAIVLGEWPAESSDDTFYEDPQYELIVFGQSDKDSDFTVELTQIAKQGGGDNLSIRFRLFKLNDDEPAPLNEEKLDNKETITKRNLYANSRSFVEHFIAPPGRYVIVASTKNTSKVAPFVIRVFSQTGCTIKNLRS